MGDQGAPELKDDQSQDFKTSTTTLSSPTSGFYKVGVTGPPVQHSLSQQISHVPLHKFPTVPLSLVRPTMPSQPSSVSSITLHASTPTISETTVASCPNMLTALMSKPKAMTVMVTSTVPSSVIVTPGTKDSEGFLTPPPASTLLLRRTRVNSTGSSTYVIASNPVTSAPSNISTSETSSLNTPEPTPELNQAEFTPGRSRSRSTSGRSIKRPKFDDERVVYKANDTGRKKDSVLLPTQTHATTLLSTSLEKFIPVEPRLCESSLVSSTELSVSPKGISEVIVSPVMSTTASLLGPGSLSTGKGISMKSKPKPKASKGKPASFMTDSVAGMKKQRKERSPDKLRNLDPRTGKRRYIKKKEFPYDMEERPRFCRTVSLSSDYSLVGEGVAFWRPMDDLRLIVNVKQTCDLKMVHVGTTFSCDFTLEHIEARWKTLLYNKNISKVSQMAIINLHSKVKANIFAQALYSKEEDELIKTIKSTRDKPDVLLKLEDLLNSNSLIFLKWRTVWHLWQHWKELKEFHLLCDQSLQNYFLHGNFADIEETVNDVDIRTENLLDNAVYQELLIENKHMRKKIRLAEEELFPWKIMAQLAAEIETNPTEDSSFAMLRGEQVRYLMRSREITLGRQSDVVDADLSLEGSAYKVSRRQCVIQLRNSGDFVIFNEGKHTIYLDGEPLLQRHMGRLRDQSIIQISGLKFIFLVNKKMVGEFRTKLIDDEMKKQREQNIVHGIRRSTATSHGKIVHQKMSSSIAPSSITQSILVSSNNLVSQTGLNVRPIQIPRYNSNSNTKTSRGAGRIVLPNSRSKVTTPVLQQHPHFSGYSHPYPTGKSSFPVLPSVTPTIFRRSSTTGTHVVPSPEVIQPQPSFQFGDLTIRAGVPPQHHHQSSCDS